MREETGWILTPGEQVMARRVFQTAVGPKEAFVAFIPAGRGYFLAAWYEGFLDPLTLTLYSTWDHLAEGFESFLKETEAKVNGTYARGLYLRWGTVDSSTSGYYKD